MKATKRESRITAARRRIGRASVVGLAGISAVSASACGRPASEGAAEAPAAVPDETSPYHILVTNDDGIESPGIQYLAAALRTVGEVTVVAPCGQQSGTSMSIRLDQDIRLRTYPEPSEAADAEGGSGADRSPVGHCVDATPAGAVLVAVRALAPESGFDLVVSGINRGANIGEVSHMSGTVGAAMMGAYLRLPAVAASQGGPPGGFEHAAGVVARFVAELRRRGPEVGIVYSLNFPAATAEDTHGIAARPMGGAEFGIDYEELAEEPDAASEGGDAERRFRPVFVAPDPLPAGSDTEAYNEGLVTITPLRLDWTDPPTVAALEGWDLEALLTDEGEGDEGEGGGADGG